MIFANMTAPELKLVDRENTFVLVPLAAVEQHGPHMPTGTDTILCTELAERLEQKLTDQILLLPTLWPGASAHHLRLGATLDVQLVHYISLLEDLCLSLLDDGFRRIVLFNGHGGNIDPLRVALRSIQLGYPDAQLVGGCYWSPAQAAINALLTGQHHFVGHACEVETSLMLHFRPELVRTNLLEPAGGLVPDDVDGLYECKDMCQRTRAGFTGRPDLATAEKGAQICEAILQQWEQTLNKLKQQPLGTFYDDFSSDLMM